ncbi:hypothetical protein ABBQ32_008632 [Trebouxia sp. C0010 RCD-2024]
MAFRDDSYGICERLEFVSCLKAYYVSLNRLKWNEVQVSDMQFMQQELAFVTNEVSKELNGEVGDKHDKHNARNRKDWDSYLNHLLYLHDQFLNPSNQPQSYIVLQHSSLEQPPMPGFAGPAEVPAGPM